MGWKVGRRQQTEKWSTVYCFLLFFWSWHHHKALLATWYPEPSWAPPVLWQVMGGGGGWGGMLGTRLAPVAVLAMVYLPPMSHSSSPLLLIWFLSLLSLCYSDPTLSHTDFFIVVSLVTYFLCCSHPLYHTPSHPHPLSFSSPLSFSHFWDCRQWWEERKWDSVTNDFQKEVKQISPNNSPVNLTRVKSKP